MTTDDLVTLAQHVIAAADAVSSPSGLVLQARHLAQGVLDLTAQLRLADTVGDRQQAYVERLTAERDEAQRTLAALRKQPIGCDSGVTTRFLTLRPMPSEPTP